MGPVKGQGINAIKVLGCLKKFGPSQNNLGPVKGQGITVLIYILYKKGQQAAWPAAAVQPYQDSPSTFQPIRNIIGAMSGKKMPKKALVNQTTNILLLSSTRSGGGFLGQLLNSIFPNMFYAIDPISLAALYQVKD